MSNYNMLVTGGAGFIGSNFVDLALQAGHNIVVLDIFSYAASMDNLSTAQKSPNFKLVKGDIADKTLVLKLLEEHKIDIVVNFAAESHVDNSINAPDVFIKTNVIGVYNMLEASRHYLANAGDQIKNKFKFIQVSTDEVFGSLELASSEKFTEHSNYDPSSPYSASKAAGDHLAKAWYRTYNFPVIVTNCSNNYGPRQFPEKLIPRMIKAALNGDNLPIYGDGKNVRDWIHVKDHARGILLAIEKGRIGETYCFGGRAEQANLELVKLLCLYLDELKPQKNGHSYSKNIIFVTDRAGHDRRYAIDDSKAESELGFTRGYNFETGLKATVSWYLE